jgi:toluene monooxygenase electron transfer component
MLTCDPMRTINVNNEASFACAEDDTLLRAGLRAGFGMPYECNAGSCGTCKVELVSGTIDSIRPDAPGLPEREAARNRVLACQARPRADCAIKVRLRPDNVPKHRPARFTATLVRTRDLTHDMREFTFATADAPGFRPGQYALFYLPGLDAPRTYSLSNIDDGSGEWQFIVRRVPGGVGTVTLFDEVAIGTGITLDGPYGMAFLREESPRDIVCVAGGSGLAPILSVVRGAVRTPGRDGRRIHVFYGARTPRDAYGRDELVALPGFGDTLTYEIAVSEPDASWTGPTGFVHERARAFIGERWNDYDYYFAGPPPMVEAVQRMLIEKRVPFPQVHFDRFY